MRNNIYITNFWYALNYGANLTAYALYKIVSESNECTYILDNLQYKEKILLGIYYIKGFTEKYFKVKNFENEENAILITGSDQVFNPNCEFDYNDSKFLNFAKITNKKIAMSASFGVDKESFLKQNSIDIINNIKTALQSFDSISVREKSGVEICKDLFDVDAEWIIDPVFILDKEKWNELINNADKNIQKQIKHKKIAGYIFDKNNKHTKALNYLSEKYKTGFIEFSDFKNSPENWLYAIKNCELFVTNSFHGVCFAIIFNKPFICLSKETGKSTRFESLFEMLGIEDNSVSLEQIYEKDCVFDIDYDLVNKKIAREQLRCMEFLKKALNTPVKNTQEKIDARINYLEQRIAELEVQNNFPYQLKKYLWEKWLIIYHGYLPVSIKKITSYVWHFIKGEKNARRK